MSDLVRQLREFPQFVSMDPGRWFQSGSKEPICQRAADELERLTRELEEARKDAQLWQFWKPWIERRVGDLSLYDANQAQEK